MIRSHTPAMGRRRFVVGGLAAAGASSCPAAPSRRGTSPRSSRPRGRFTRSRCRPTSTTTSSCRAARGAGRGRVTHHGPGARVLDGKPASSARVEIWQCDARGRYLHPATRAGARPRLPGLRAGAVRRRTARTALAPSSRCLLSGTYAAYPFLRHPGARRRPGHPDVCGRRALNERDGSTGRSATRASAPPSRCVSPANGREPGAWRDLRHHAHLLA